jgi:endo-1,4-beta-xylanase
MDVPGRTIALSRRSALAGAAATLAMTARGIAQQGLIPFGAAVMIADFRAEARLRQELQRQCDIIVPMNELKWEAVRRKRDGFDLKDADEILTFARQNGKQAHGHALLWGEALPSWVKTIIEPRVLERELIRHIETLVPRLADRLTSWDVVNEVIAHDPRPEAPMRDTIWQRLLGPRHVDLAFQTAARAAPSLKLVLNDYDLENPDERTRERRRQVLRLVRHLQDRKIPVHEVGFQAHLYAEKPLDPRGITALCRELGRLGVGVRVTELDVIDWKLPAETADRDRRIAALTGEFLGAVIEGQRPSSIVTWGLSDRSSWIHDTFRRQDGARARPLPLDADYRAKPMMAAIQAARRQQAPRA